MSNPDVRGATDADALGPARGRPKDDTKRAAILDAARRLFLEDAYDRVSVDQIAAAAGVSKVTVYSHFPGGKEDVFVAAMSASADAVFGGAVVAVEAGAPLEEALARLAADFIAMITDPEVVAMQAVMMAEGQRDPKLPQMFFDQVVSRWTSVLARLLQREMDRGVLLRADAGLCASQFLAMAHGEFKYRSMLHLGNAGPDEVAAYGKACAALFLRALRP